jgi:hypothetical protein
MQQLLFIWNHLGRLRKWILAGCLLMTKATDVLGFLPDRWKQHTEWLFPSWGWIGWMVAFLLLLVAFTIEESYVRQSHIATPGHKNFKLPTYALVAIGLVWVTNVVWARVHSHQAAPTAVQGAPPTSNSAPARPVPVQPVAKTDLPKIQDTPVAKAPPVIHHVAKPKKPKATSPDATTLAATPVALPPTVPDSTASTTRPPNPNCTSTTNWKNIHTNGLEYGIVIEDGGHCDNFDGDTVFENGKVGYLHESPLDPRTGKPYFQPNASQPAASQPSPSQPSPSQPVANPAPQQ